MPDDLIIPALPADIADRIPDVVRAVINAHGLGSVDVHFRPGLGLSVGLRANPGGRGTPLGQPLPVMLTGRGETPGEFTWVEREWKKNTQSWGAKVGALTDASDGYGKAREWAGRWTIPLGSIQFIAPDPFMVTEDDGPVFTFKPVQAWILMKITDNSATGDRPRWLYTASEVTVEGTTVTTVTDGLMLTEELRNLAETLYPTYGSSPFYVAGMQVRGSANFYPAGFAPRPVGGAGTSDTHKYNQIHRVWESAQNPGTFFFSHVNSHDGACEEP